MVNCMHDPWNFSYKNLHRRYSNVQDPKTYTHVAVDVSLNRLTAMSGYVPEMFPSTVDQYYRAPLISNRHKVEDLEVYILTTNYISREKFLYIFRHEIIAIKLSRLTVST